MLDHLPDMYQLGPHIVHIQAFKIMENNCICYNVCAILQVSTWYRVRT